MRCDQVDVGVGNPLLLYSLYMHAIYHDAHHIIVSHVCKSHKHAWALSCMVVFRIHHIGVEFEV